MSQNNNQIESRLWSAADELRANSKLKSSEYSVPVLGLIFLRYADHKFSAVEVELAGQRTGRRKIGATDYQARGVMYLPPEARFSSLLQLFILYVIKSVSEYMGNNLQESFYL
jgi:type I restriction enzyme M protein